MAAEYEAKRTRGNYLEAAKKAALKAPDRDGKLDKLVDCGPFSMETHVRMPQSWLNAEKVAEKLDARLPTFEE